MCLGCGGVDLSMSISNNANDVCGGHCAAPSLVEPTTFPLIQHSRSHCLYLTDRFALTNLGPLPATRNRSSVLSDRRSNFAASACVNSDGSDGGSDGGERISNSHEGTPSSNRSCVGSTSMNGSRWLYLTVCKPADTLRSIPANVNAELESRDGKHRRRYGSNPTLRGPKEGPGTSPCRVMVGWRRARFPLLAEGAPQAAAYAGAGN
jgi:hypothetical protein